MLGCSDAYCRVSVARCKPGTNPNEVSAGIVQYAFSNYTTPPPSFPVWRSTNSPVTGPWEDGAESPPFSTKHTGKPSCGDPGNANLTSFTLANVFSNTGQVRHRSLQQGNLVYRRMRMGVAQHELARDKGSRFLPRVYSYTNRRTLSRRFIGTILPVGVYVCSNRHIHLRRLRKPSANTLTPAQYVLLFLDNPGSVKLTLSSARHIKLLEPYAAGGVYKCTTLGTPFIGGFVDESRRASFSNTAD